MRGPTPMPPRPTGAPAGGNLLLRLLGVPGGLLLSSGSLSVLGLALALTAALLHLQIVHVDRLSPHGGYLRFRLRLPGVTDYNRVGWGSYRGRDKERR